MRTGLKTTHPVRPVRSIDDIVAIEGHLYDDLVTARNLYDLLLATAEHVGERKAREMVYTCRLYSAQQALEMGLINQVCPADKLDEEVEKLCNEILDKSPQSIRIAKVALNAGSDQEFYSSYFPTSELLASIYGNEENMEGITAFLEKRPSNFRKFRKR